MRTHVVICSLFCLRLVLVCVLRKSLDWDFCISLCDIDLCLFDGLANCVGNLCV
jgi:hypothetical protein